MSNLDIHAAFSPQKHGKWQLWQNTENSDTPGTILDMGTAMHYTPRNIACQQHELVEMKWQNRSAQKLETMPHII